MATLRDTTRAFRELRGEVAAVNRELDGLAATRRGGGVVLDSSGRQAVPSQDPNGGGGGRGGGGRGGGGRGGGGASILGGGRSPGRSRQMPAEEVLLAAGCSLQTIDFPVRALADDRLAVKKVRAWVCPLGSGLEPYYLVESPFGDTGEGATPAGGVGTRLRESTTASQRILANRLFVNRAGSVRLERKPRSGGPRGGKTTSGEALAVTLEGGGETDGDRAVVRAIEGQTARLERALAPRASTIGRAEGDF